MDADDWRRTVRAATTAFFLDVDGTLLGFKDRPGDVVADATCVRCSTVCSAPPAVRLRWSAGARSRISTGSWRP